MKKLFVVSALALILAAPQVVFADTTTTEGNIHVAKYGEGTFVTTTTKNGNVTTMDTVYTFDCGLTVDIDRTTTHYQDGTKVIDTTYTYNGYGFDNKVTTMDLTDTPTGQGSYSFVGTWTGGGGATDQVTGTWVKTSVGHDVDWTFVNSKNEIKTRDDVEETEGDYIYNTVTLVDFDGVETIHTNKRHIKGTGDGDNFSLGEDGEILF
jgi:hypothetical protein